MKNCTPLWREAHFQVKIYKTPHVRTTFEVPMLKKCTPLWREAHFQVKMYKTHHVRTTFWSQDVKYLHAISARSTFQSQNVKRLTVSDHFLKSGCGKFARRCSEKHISTSKCAKHLRFETLLEVPMSKRSPTEEIHWYWASQFVS